MPEAARDPKAQREGLAYYWLPADVRVGADGLQTQGLPPVPLTNIHLATIEDRQTVAFLAPNLFLAIEYICCLPRVGIRKETSPSQKKFV